METHVVIMAGGIGSRLWPVSTPQTPKQFIDVLGVGRTMIQLTIDRFSSICKKENFWIVTGERYVETVRRQIPEIPESNILAEPEPRNTAPCIAYACWKIAQKCPDANVVVTPSDALVLKTGKFAQVIGKAVDAVGGNDSIVTVGIKPTRPETGYGYICSEGTEEDVVTKVSEFKEKPDHETAGKYLAAGNFFWNAGIFVWNVQTVINAIRTHAGQIAGIMDRIAPSFFTDMEQPVLKELFPQCEKISIDYAVMEKSRNIKVIASDLGWSDLGTWGSVGEHLEADCDGNKYVGSDVRMFGCHNVTVHAAQARTVVVQGLENYIVAENDGNILVCSLADEQNIKEYSKQK